MALTSPRFARNDRLQAAANNQPPLKTGETGEAVEILQQALIDLGASMPRSTNPSGLTDGIYGPETAATVTAFQASQGLSQDGIAGKDTLGKLDSIYAHLESLERAKLVAELNTPAPFGPWYIS